MSKFKDVAIITVRNSSSRLPNKAIMKIKNRLRSIDIVIERAKQTGRAASVQPGESSLQNHRDNRDEIPASWSIRTMPTRILRQSTTRRLLRHKLRLSIST